MAVHDTIGDYLTIIRNASMARIAPGLCNWASAEGNGLTRPLLEKTLGVHHDAPLPKFASKSLQSQAKAKPAQVNAAAPAHGRKALIFATCFAEHNRTETGMAALAYRPSIVPKLNYVVPGNQEVERPAFT